MVAEFKAPLLLLAVSLVLAVLTAGSQPAIAANANARYVMHAAADPAAPEGEPAKVAVWITAAVPGRRYFLHLKRTSAYKQPAKALECRDSAATIAGIRADPSGKVEFAPQPGGPYVLGGAHLCKGTYEGQVLEQRPGRRGARVVRRFRLSAPSLALTTVRT